MYPGPHGQQYPTNWALNPVAYQNVSADQVDWASLAQQWILMKETCPSTEMVPPAPPPPKTSPKINAAEQGEAPMDVENDDDQQPASAANSQWSTAGWNYSGHSWPQNSTTNNWAWGGAGAGTTTGIPTPVRNIISSGPLSVVPGSSPPIIAPPAPAGTGIAAPHPKPSLLPTPYNNFGDIPFQNNQSSTDQSSSYWGTPSAQHNSGSLNRSRLVQPSKTELPSIMPNFFSNSFTLDAAKRKQLPAWIREGLEKMERQKQKQVDKEREMKDRELYLEQKRIEEEQAMKELEKEGKPIVPKKSRFDSDSEDEDKNKKTVEQDRIWSAVKPIPNTKIKVEKPVVVQPKLPLRSREERMQDVMMNVRRVLTQILLEVTTEEIASVCDEVIKRVRSTAPAQTLRKTQALTSLTGGLGLGIYGGDSSGDSEGSEDDGVENEEQNKDSDLELQESIAKRKAAFEKTSRDIEARMEADQVRSSRRQKISVKVVDNSDNEVASSTDGEPLDKKQSPVGKNKSVASPNSRKQNYEKNVRQKSSNSKEMYNKNDQKNSNKNDAENDSPRKSESYSKLKSQSKSDSDDSESGSTSSDNSSSSSTCSDDSSSDKHSKKRQSKTLDKTRYKKSKKTKHKDEFKQPTKTNKIENKDTSDISGKEKVYKDQQIIKTSSTSNRSSKEQDSESNKARKARSKSRGRSRSLDRHHKSTSRRSRSKSIDNHKYNRRKSLSRSVSSSRRSRHYTRSPSPDRRRSSISKSKRYRHNTRSSSRDDRSSSRMYDRQRRSASKSRYRRRRSRSYERRRSSTLDRDYRNDFRGRHRSRGRRSRSPIRKSRSRNRHSRYSRSSSRRYRSRSRGKRSSHKH